LARDPDRRGDHCLPQIASFDQHADRAVDAGTFEPTEPVELKGKVPGYFSGILKLPGEVVRAPNWLSFPY